MSLNTCIYFKKLGILKVLFLAKKFSIFFIETFVEHVINVW